MATSFGPITTRLEMDTSVFDRGVTQSVRRLNTLQGRFRDFNAELKTAANVMIASGAALGIGLAPGVKAAQQLEQALARSFSVGELTTKQMFKLRQETLALGRGVVGPGQLAEGLYNLASAGFDVEEQLATLPTVSKLAIASMVDLDTASQLVVQALRAFNLEATDAARVGNLVAASNATSSSNAVRLADAYRMVAATAATIGLNIEETTTSLNFLIDVMQSGEMAGTGLRNVLARLTTGSTELADAADASGISLRDLNPQTAGMASALTNLNLLLDDGADFFRIFGTEGANAASILATQADAFVEMQEAITGTNQLQKQYDLQMKTTINRLVALRNGIQATAISYGQGLKPLVDGAIESLRVFDEVVNSIPQGLKSLIGVIGVVSGGLLFFGGIWARIALTMVEAGVASRVLAFATTKLGLAQAAASKHAAAVVALTELRVKALLLERVAEQQAAATVIAAAQARIGMVTAEAVAKSHAAAVDLATKAAQARAAVQLASAQTASTSVIVAGSTLQAVAMLALRQAMAIAFETTKRFYGFMLRLLALPLTRWLVLAGLALRAMADHGQVLRPAIEAIEDSVRRFMETLAPVAGVLAAVNRAFSTLALRAVVLLADAMNVLNRSMESTVALMRFFETVGNNPLAIGAAFAELRAEADRIQTGFEEVRDAITAAGTAAYDEINGITTDVDNLAASLGLTEERLEELTAAMEEFIANWSRDVHRITFDLNATPLQRQLAAVDDQVRNEIEALREFAESEEGELMLRIDVDGNYVEDVADSLFQSLLDKVEATGEEARQILQDNFIDELQDRVDSDWVASIQEGGQRAIEEHRRRNEEIRRLREEARASLEEGSAQANAAEAAFAELLILSNRQLLRDLEEISEQVADTVAEAERAVVDAQIDAMQEGEAKLRAQYAQRVADARERSQERLEAVGDDAAAAAAIIQAEEQLVALLYASMEREIAEHQRTVARAAQASLRAFEDTLNEMRRATARVEAENTGNAYQELLVRQAQALEDAGERVRDALASFEEAVEDGTLGEAEAAQRSLQVLSAWGRQEAALLAAQAGERRRYFAEQEAELIRHNRDIAAIYARAAATRIDDPVVAADTQRNTDLADLRAWYAERIALAGDDTAERLRIDERYAAESELITATHQARLTQIEADARRERVEAEAAAGNRLRASGVAGVLSARDLESSIAIMREAKRELLAIGATAEEIEPLAEAIAESATALIDLRREAEDFETDALTSIANEIQGIEDSLFLDDEGRLRVALERRIAGFDDELQAARVYLRSRYADDELYFAAVAELEEAYGRLRGRLRDAEVARQAERERERVEKVVDAEERLTDELAAARNELVRDQVARVEGAYRLEAAIRRREHERMMDDLKLTNAERVRVTSHFLMLERLREEAHWREIATIRRQATQDAIEPAIEQARSVEAAQLAERQRLSRTQVVETEAEIKVRESAVKAQERSIETTEKEIEVLKERGQELIDSMTAITSVRSYFEQVRSLFQSPLRFDSGDITRDPKRYAEEQREIAEQLYRDAVKANLPLETRQALLRDLVDLNERVIELGGQGLRGDRSLVAAAQDEFRATIAEAQKAAAEYERNQRALEGLEAALSSMVASVDELKLVLEGLSETLAGLNDQSDLEIWSDIEGRFLSLAESADEARSRYAEALTELIDDVDPSLLGGDVVRLADQMVAQLEAGDFEDALANYARVVGEGMPRGMIEGLLSSPIPGDTGRTLAERLGIDDIEAYAAEAAGEAAEVFNETFGGNVDAGEVEDTLPEIAQRINEGVDDMGGTAGKGLMQAFADGILTNRQILLNAVEDVLRDVRERLPSSDAKRGPLSDLTRSGKRFVRTWVGGAESESGYLAKHIDGLLGSAQIGGAPPGRVRHHPAGGGPGGGYGPVTVNLPIEGRQAPPAVAFPARDLARAVARELRVQGGR